MSYLRRSCPYLGQWTLDQWQSALGVRNAITGPIDQLIGIGDYLHTTSRVPE